MCWLTYCPHMLHKNAGILSKNSYILVTGIQCCGSRMSYSGSESSFEFSEIRSESTFGSGSNPYYLSIIEKKNTLDSIKKKNLPVLTSRLRPGFRSRPVLGRLWLREFVFPEPAPAPEDIAFLHIF